jgi:hypothetical protein
MGVGTHPALGRRCKRGEIGNERAVLVEELLGSIAPHPLLEHVEVIGVVANVRHRHLV